jgi:DNA-binding MarR family transcriptional regulator
VRQAARHITQFYDQFLAASWLRTTQFSIRAKLRRLGPMTINVLAADLVMDRTTLGRNILPLERDGLIAVEKGRRDRRSTLRLTEAGQARFRAAVKEWAEAQKQFEAAFRTERTIDLRPSFTRLPRLTSARTPSAPRSNPTCPVGRQTCSNHPKG